MTALVPLECPSCGSGLTAGPWDVVFLCRHCGGGARLGPDGLLEVEAVALAASPGRTVTGWRPAWLLDTTVAIRDRVVAGGGRSPDRRGSRRFLVAAWDLPLADLVRLARAHAATAAGTGELMSDPIPGGRISVEDAVAVARHVVIGEEVQAPDQLTSLTVDLELERARLAAVPVEETADRCRCAVTGVGYRVRRAGGGRSAR